MITYITALKAVLNFIMNIIYVHSVWKLKPPYSMNLHKQFIFLLPPLSTDDLAIRCILLHGLTVMAFVVFDLNPYAVNRCIHQFYILQYFRQNLVGHYGLSKWVWGREVNIYWFLRGNVEWCPLGRQFGFNMRLWEWEVNGTGFRIMSSGGCCWTFALDDWYF